MNQEEYVDIRPWPVAELAGQLVRHVALGRRGLIEVDAETDLFERETDRLELEAWAKLELSSWLGPGDTEILEVSIGKLGELQHERCGDAMVIGSTIAWAIRVVNAPSLPLVSDGADEQRTTEWAPDPWTPVRSIVKGIRLRSDEDLAIERERWELVAWRCSLFDDPVMVEDDRRALRETLAEIRAHGLTPANDRDFVLENGTAFNDLDDDAFNDLARQAALRLRTLNWVCGFGDSPESAPLFLDEER